MKFLFFSLTLMSVKLGHAANEPEPIVSVYLGIFISLSD